MKMNHDALTGSKRRAFEELLEALEEVAREPYEYDGWRKICFEAAAALRWFSELECIEVGDDDIVRIYDHRIRELNDDLDDELDIAGKAFEATTPEYVKCVLTGMVPEGVPEKITWCGRAVTTMEFCFVDASHALLNARQEGRLLICPECANKMREALDRGTAE